MKKSEISSVDRFQHKLQIWDCINNGMSNQMEIGRQLGIVTSDSNGTNLNWHVYDLVQELLSEGRVVKVGRKLEATGKGFDWFMKNAIGHGEEE